VEAVDEAVAFGVKAEAVATDVRAPEAGVVLVMDCVQMVELCVPHVMARPTGEELEFEHTGAPLAVVKLVWSLVKYVGRRQYPLSPWYQLPASLYKALQASRVDLFRRTRARHRGLKAEGSEPHKIKNRTRPCESGPWLFLALVLHASAMV
jgi:hypothetical protein